ncbi:zinc finger protein 84, partial [Trichonephila inaurata madagascariensis]
MEAYQSNVWKSVNQNDFVQEFDDSEQYSMLETKAFQNFQTEFQPTGIQGLIGYPCENTALQYNQQIEGIFMEPQMYITSRKETSSYWQSHFQVDQPKSLFECKFSTGANTELRPETVEEDSFGIPYDNRRTPTARDALLGMDSLNNELLSQNIDSLLLEIPPSDFNIFDSKDKMSILKGELLATNFGSTSDNSWENTELSNNLFQHDFSAEHLNPSWSYINSKSFTEDCNFQTQAKSNFETLYPCDTCLNTFNSKDMLLRHKCIFSRDKHFQYEIYERNFSPTGHLSEIKSAETNEKFFQCGICKQTLLQTNFEWHMLTHTASPNQGVILKEKISETEHFNRLMCTNTEEKTYQCNICKRKFSLKPNLARHM